MSEFVQISKASRSVLNQNAADIAERALALAPSSGTLQEILRDYDEVCQLLSESSLVDGSSAELQRILVELAHELRREIGRHEHVTLENVDRKECSLPTTKQEELE